MANLWQKTLFYLGLVDEDEADAYASGGYARQRGPAEAVPRPTPQVEPRETRVGQRLVDPPPQERPTGVVGRRVEPPLTTRRRTSADSALAEAGVIITGSDVSAVRTVSSDDLESEIIVARSYSDAQALADHIRSSVPVVVDLRKVEPAMVRRLVDFASGLTYALGGSMRKIGQGVILVTPANVNIGRDERRRLADMGYYQAPEA
jgi:FtsZ-interacting cell division protein YlmF